MHLRVTHLGRRVGPTSLKSPKFTTVRGFHTSPTDEPEAAAPATSQAYDSQSYCKQEHRAAELEHRAAELKKIIGSPENQAVIAADVSASSPQPSSSTSQSSSTKESSKFLWLIGLLFALAGLSQYEDTAATMVQDFVNKFNEDDDVQTVKEAIIGVMSNTEVTGDYLPDERRISFPENARELKNYLNNGGAASELVIVIGDNKRMSMDADELMTKIAPNSTFFLRPICQESPIELIRILSKIYRENNSGAIIVLPKVSTSDQMSSILNPMLGRVLDRIISHLVIKQGVHVIAPASSDPDNVYAWCKNVILVASQANAGTCRADLFVPVGQDQYYAAGAITRMRVGMPKESCHLSKADIKYFFERVSSGIHLIELPLKPAQVAPALTIKSKEYPSTSLWKRIFGQE